MNLVTVDISDFRSNLSDYLTLVSLGQAVISIKNGKNGKEVARIIPSTTPLDTLEKRLEELDSLAGFAATESPELRAKFTRLSTDYTKKLKRDVVE